MALGMTGLLGAVVTIAILCLIAWLITWFIDWIGVIPAVPAKILKIIVYIIVGYKIVVILLGLLGGGGLL